MNQRYNMLQFFTQPTGLIVIQKELRKQHKQDKKIEKLCLDTLEQLEVMKQRHGDPQINYKEVKGKVYREYEIARDEYNRGLFFPQLLYKFYFISTLFEILTVYNIEKVLRRQYSEEVQTALAYAVQTKKKLIKQNGKYLSQYSLLNQICSNLPQNLIDKIGKELDQTNRSICFKLMNKNSFSQDTDLNSVFLIQLVKIFDQQLIFFVKSYNKKIQDKKYLVNKWKNIMKKFEIFRNTKTPLCQNFKPKQSTTYNPQEQTQYSSRQSNSLYDHLQNYNEKSSQQQSNNLNYIKSNKNIQSIQNTSSQNHLFIKKGLSDNYSHSFSTQDSHLRSNGLLSQKNSNESQSQQNSSYNLSKNDSSNQQNSFQQLLEGRDWLQNYDPRNIDVSLSDKQIEYFQNLEKNFEENDTKNNQQYAYDLLIELEKENKVLKMVLEDENNKNSQNVQCQQYINQQKTKINELMQKKLKLENKIKQESSSNHPIDLSQVLDKTSLKEGQRLTQLIQQNDQIQITNLLNEYLENLKKQILKYQIDNENLKLIVENTDNQNEHLITCYNKIQEISQQNQDYSKKIQYFKNIIQNDQKLQDIYNKQLKIKQLRTKLEKMNLKVY